MVSMHVKDSLKKEVENCSLQIERAGVAMAEAGTVEEGIEPRLEESADHALDQLVTKTKEQSVSELVREYSRPSSENMRSFNGMRSMCSATILDIKPKSVSNLLSMAAFVPTEAELQDHIRDEVRRNTDENRARDDQRKLDELMKPKKDNFDRVYDFLKEHVSKAAEMTKGEKVLQQTILLTKVPSHGIISPLKQGVASGDLLPLVSGALPTIMVVKMLCMKVARIRLFRDLAAPLTNNRGRNFRV